MKKLLRKSTCWKSSPSSKTTSRPSAQSPRAGGMKIKGFIRWQVGGGGETAA